ncbi:MAG: hypothetical protein ACXW3Z_08065 [Limisphaerales bacterium]
MDNTIQLRSFVRSGASIYIARISEVSIRPDPSSGQVVALELKIEQTLWGEAGKPIRRSEFTQPDDETARLKFPHPIWGRVDPREGAVVFLVTHELLDVAADPVYVEEIHDANDAVLAQIKKVLEEEKAEEEPPARSARYLGYLTEGGVVEKLFGAESLAKDLNNLEEAQADQVALAMARVFGGSESVYVRLSVGTWMCENIYPRAGHAGRVTVINAALKGLEDASEDIRRYALNFLANIDAAAVGQPGVVSTQASIGVLQKRLSAETEPEIRDRFQNLVNALKGTA